MGIPVNLTFQGSIDEQLLTHDSLRYLTKSLFTGWYAFDNQGGAVGAIPLWSVVDNQPFKIPNNFILTQCILLVTAPLTSLGSASVALSATDTSGDLVAATLVSAEPWASDGLKQTLVGPSAPLFMHGNIHGFTPEIVVSGADLTAGLVFVFLEGYGSAE